MISTSAGPRSAIGATRWSSSTAIFDGRWHGDCYPWNSHALTVIRRDQLRAKNIAPVALRGDALRGLEPDHSLQARN